MTEQHDKPHRGTIKSWRKVACDKGLGYYITGRFVDHPIFAGDIGYTSYVVKSEYICEDSAPTRYEIETRNSRYTLVGEELK